MHTPNHSHPATDADIAVVISTYNRPRALDLVLDGFSRQRLRARQLVVADDGSGPETAEVLERWRGRGLPIEHCWQEDRGYRKSPVLNAAIRAVRSPWCVFTDGDCIPLPGFIEDHAAFAERGFVLAGPRMLTDATLAQDLEAGRDTCFDRGWPWWLGQRLRGRINRLLPLVRLPDGRWRKRRPHKWELVRGCNFAVATASLWAVGGFEEDYLGWGGEDSDIAVRLINADVRVKSLRCAAPVLHLWHREESRANRDANFARVDAARAEGRVRARAGLPTAGRG